jgi:hypothetical protein
MTDSRTTTKHHEIQSWGEKRQGPVERFFAQPPPSHRCPIWETRPQPPCLGQTRLNLHLAPT